MRRIRKGDMVEVISGKYKGARGRVLAVLVDDDAVIVEGINKKKRHSKPSARTPQGGIVEREAPMAACKVMPIDPKSDKPTRVRVRVDEQGNKVRVAVRSGEVLASTP